MVMRKYKRNPLTGKINVGKPRKPLTKPLRRLISNVIDRKSESKMAIWYNPALPAVAGAVAGSYNAYGWNDQNQLITTNASDIRRCIPLVAQGSAPNQRNGVRITPKSLVVKGAVAVNINGTVGTVNQPRDLYVVMYFLQHVTLKSYAALAANDFTEMLNTGEDSTGAFQGFQRDKDLPVNTSSYRLLKKKVFPLRWAGITQAPVPSAGIASIANSHTYNAQYTVNLSKHLPKVLKYPETADANNQDPTNSSIFLCMGFVDMQSVASANDPNLPELYINQTYTAQMTWKDL